MIRKVFLKEVITNNLIFIALIGIFLIIGQSGIFKRDGWYGGYDLLLPIFSIIIFVFIIQFFLWRKKSVKGLKNVRERLIYCYSSFLLTLFFVGTILEGFTTNFLGWILLMVPFFFAMLIH